MSDDKALTLHDAGILADIMRGVESNAKLNWYLFGADSAENPLRLVMRAFTHYGGGFWPNDADVRDACVWCSGFMERWIPVRDLMKALDNLDGKFGETDPIAVINPD
jgi:hypothetical protein